MDRRNGILLGHGRARGVGVEGHNSFEVFLKGGAYGEGRWALLDHDISTVVYDPAGTRLLSIPDVKADLKNLIDRNYMPEKQHGWLVCGLDAGDGSVYKRYDVAEYLPGYAGPPPIVHLRRGETMRRYFEPGLENGKTFVFWGRNYNTAGIPGPERSQTWVNQPEKMHGSKDGTGHHEGQARYANVVYTYHPDFRPNNYLEGLIEQTAQYMTFEFYTPYIIAATPPNKNDWGVYDPGCKNGLIVRGLANTRVEVSPDQGSHWFSGYPGREVDLTDFVKGHRQYWLRFYATPSDLANARIEIQTTCQAAVGVLPRLKEDGATVSFESSGRAIVSAGPNVTQAKSHIVAGKFNSPQVTLELATPRGEEALEIYAAAHVASGNPPTSDIKYQIEYSIDSGKTWKPVVKDWTIPRQGEEPADFWSQSMCYGSAKVEGDTAKALVRFRNSGGRNYLRAEAHLVYRTRGPDATRVTYFWTDSRGEHIESRHISAGRKTDKWTLRTASKVRNRWVEIEDVAP
jgi:hypothetical protein